MLSTWGFFLVFYKTPAKGLPFTRFGNLAVMKIVSGCSSFCGILNGFKLNYSAHRPVQDIFLCHEEGILCHCFSIQRALAILKSSQQIIFMCFSNIVMFESRLAWMGRNNLKLWVVCSFKVRIKRPDFCTSLFENEKACAVRLNPVNVSR